jgi:carbamate kinase
MSKAGTIVVALGGNALQPPGESGTIGEQFAHTRESLAPVVALARDGWHIVIVHGNGPQIGDELKRNELARELLPPLPLGVLVAATAGWIGYMVQQSLQNALKLAGVKRRVVTMVTQVVVDPDDAATYEPVKPIGREMTEPAARALAEEHGWTIGESGGGWRRLVASPLPVGIVEREQIRRLVESGVIVIALGGGGVPVHRDPELGLDGVDGVVDKDRAAQVLAEEIAADTFLILTNVEGVYRGFGTPQQELLGRIDLAQAKALLAAGELGRGSMAPKVESACAFVARSGGRAIIARLDRGMEAVAGKSGTTIVP